MTIDVGDSSCAQAVIVQVDPPDRPYGRLTFS